MLTQTSWRSRALRWSAELLLVFLGAYAAFWLTNHQEHQNDIHRRQQILTALEEQISADLGTIKALRVTHANALAVFQRKLDAGEMPPLNTFAFTTDYSATDVATLLQSGGYQLLDVKTLVALRHFDFVLRGGISTMQRAQQLSDTTFYSLLSTLYFPSPHSPVLAATLYASTTAMPCVPFFPRTTAV